MEEGYSLTQAVAEADRCLLCHDAPCSAACPAETDPGKFIRKLRLRNLKGAVRTIKENNILGGICAVVCPAGRLCEEKCSSTEIDRPINIGKLQRFLVEYGWQIGFNPLLKKPANGAKVAVVGSGPAGLACAAALSKEGCEVTVFESARKPGGVLRYGVPSFRLDGDFTDREIKDVAALGVKIECGSPVKGRGAVENLLKKGFKAVFVGAGLPAPYKLNIPGINLKNVTTATDFLKAARAGNREKISRLVKNKNVAIIGGGSVAMDAAGTCKALKAAKVYCIALESMRELPAYKDDWLMAVDNGIIIKPQCRVREITGKGGAAAGVKGVETVWKKPGSCLPSNAKDVPGTEFSLAAGAVIIAIGSGPDRGLAEMMPKVKLTGRGLIQVDKKTLATSAKGIYAGGDAARGPALVVDSVADGKKAAGSIIGFLKGAK
ncbi:MAG: FAD-dependent oxidoreductase [Elusimicrobia bacterium]|nr:FAD-dependent oxidoreductase [Elusimicrobiota bacterium]